MAEDIDSPRRQLEYLPSGTQLPRGTRIVVRMHTNKDLRQVELYDPEQDERIIRDVAADADDRRLVEYEIPVLERDTALEVSLLDTDNVWIERPQRILITMV